MRLLTNISDGVLSTSVKHRDLVAADGADLVVVELRCGVGQRLWEKCAQALDGQLTLYQFSSFGFSRSLRVSFAPVLASVSAASFLTQEM